MDYSKVTVIIPTLNEEKHIAKLVGLIERFYPGVNVIISDDGSKDKTQEIVKRLHLRNPKITLLDRSDKKVHGLAASVVDGAKIAKTKHIVVMDGDLQHPPEKIANIVKELKTFDVVVGTRTGGFLPDKMTIYEIPVCLYRFAMSRIAKALASFRLLLNGIKCKDPMSGFFGVKTKIIKNMDESNFELEGYKVLFDLIKHLSYGAKLGKAYYIFGIRKGGDSKMGIKHMIIFFRSLFK